MPPTDPNPNFAAALDRTLRRRSQATAPAGLEQRLAAALLNQSDAEAVRPIAEKAKEPRMATLVPSLPTPVFRTAEALRSPRSRTSIWTAVGLHAAAVFLIGIAVLAQTRVTVTIHPVPEAVVLNVPPPPMPLPPAATASGGGGGHHDIAPASAGHLPRPSPLQIVPLKAPPAEQPRLPAEPTIDVQRDLKIADSTLPNIGAPNSRLNGSSLGAGLGAGIGEGNGPGVGPGSNGNFGGGTVYAIGGTVSKPIPLNDIEPEFSEEARRNKFSGDVVVYLQVNEQGLPDHIRVARGVGMGLDEQAVLAVQKYRFKPAMKDGKPVRVGLYVHVNFNLY